MISFFSTNDFLFSIYRKDQEDDDTWIIGRSYKIKNIACCSIGSQVDGLSVAPRTVAVVLHALSLRRYFDILKN
jgi:hypothetical protein